MIKQAHEVFEIKCEKQKEYYENIYTKRLEAMSSEFDKACKRIGKDSTYVIIPDRVWEEDAAYPRSLTYEEEEDFKELLKRNGYYIVEDKAYFIKPKFNVRDFIENKFPVIKRRKFWGNVFAWFGMIGMCAGFAMCVCNIVVAIGAPLLILSVISFVYGVCNV